MLFSPKISSTKTSQLCLQVAQTDLVRHVWPAC